MTKKELIAFIAERSGISKSSAERALNAATEGIAEGLKNEGIVILPNFATFKIVDRAERVSRNPRTGAKIIVPAKRKVVARISGGYQP